MRLILGCFLAVVVTAAFAAPVGAGGKTTTDSTDGSRTIPVEANHDTPPGTSPTGKNILHNCTIHPNLNPTQLTTTLTNTLGPTGWYLAPFNPETPPTNDTHYHLIGCPKNTTNQLHWTTWETTDPPPPTAVTAVALHAYNQTQLPLPTPQTSPPGNLQIPLIVNAQTWYWTDETLWQPATATAELPIFGISVTATATPTQSTWNPGDGTPPITCTHGTPWINTQTNSQPNSQLNSQANATEPDCAHIYTTTTPADEPFTLTATTTWEVTYTCVPVGYCPRPPNIPGTITTNIQRPIWITEIKGLLTN